MPDTLYDLTRDERRAAVKAFRRLPREERREAFRRAGNGERHPDPAVARTVEDWSRAVLRRAWWNKLPPWVQPTACVLLALIGWQLGAGVVLVPGAGVAFLVGLAEWSIRRTARLTLRAATSDLPAANLREQSATPDRTIDPPSADAV